MPNVNQYNGYSPARPPNVRDIELIINGNMTWLGVIVSSGAAVDNSTTATPFNNTTATGSLSGKCLLVQPTAAGHILGASGAIGSAGVLTVTTFSSTTPAAGTSPGVKVQSEERVPFFMLPGNGYLQFIPTSGSANLWVWELT